MLLAVLLLVVAATAPAAARSGDQHGRLAPRSADRFGGKAITELLMEHGISVRVGPHSPAVLLPALSARLGPAQGNLSDLLFGPAPSDDRALVRLADQLDTLEGEIRTSKEGAEPHERPTSRAHRDNTTRRARRR